MADRNPNGCTDRKNACFRDTSTVYASGLATIIPYARRIDRLLSPNPHRDRRDEWLLKAAEKAEKALLVMRLQSLSVASSGC